MYIISEISYRQFFSVYELRNKLLYIDAQCTGVLVHFVPGKDTSWAKVWICKCDII